MRTFAWPTDDGWPYPDGVADRADPEADPDDDLLSLRVPPPHLYDELDPLERAVIWRHYGLGGRNPRTMAELRTELGLDDEQLEGALGTGLGKLRSHLSCD